MSISHEGVSVLQPGRGTETSFSLIEYGRPRYKAQFLPTRLDLTSDLDPRFHIPVESETAPKDDLADLQVHLRQVRRFEFGRISMESEFEQQTNSPT